MSAFLDTVKQLGEKKGGSGSKPSESLNMAEKSSLVPQPSQVTSSSTIAQRKRQTKQESKAASKLEAQL